jgi:hypothetical protein
MGTGVVKIAERLIQENNVGAGCEGANEGHPLLLSTGNLVRVPVSQITDSGELEELGNATLAMPAPTPGHPEGDVALHRQMREKGKVLEDDADVPLLRGYQNSRPCHPAPEYLDLAPVGGIKSRDKTQGRRLA